MKGKHGLLGIQYIGEQIYGHRREAKNSFVVLALLCLFPLIKSIRYKILACLSITHQREKN
jgi:hypothetical protein